MALADIVRNIEVSANRRGIVRKRREGWRPAIVPYTGYGSVTEARVLARVIMVEPGGAKPFDVSNAADPASPLRSLSRQARAVAASIADTAALEPAFHLADEAVTTAEEAQRGWRQFFTTQVGNFPMLLTLGKQQVKVRSDREGYVDVVVTGHGLDAGWHTATLRSAHGPAVSAPVLIVSQAARFGVVSDIDDTIMVTRLPRRALAAWNSFVLRTDAREQVPGMASFLRSLTDGSPDAPCFYLSTGAWNTYPTLQRFIGAHHFPGGPLLLTDWGPTPTGLFRDGPRHKHVQLRNLMLMFPDIQWFLVGDDGQHDPVIFEQVARDWPRRVAGVALRTLAPAEHLLASGTLWGLEQSYGFPRAAQSSIPLFTGTDGFALQAALRLKE